MPVDFFELRELKLKLANFTQRIESHHFVGERRGDVDRLPDVDIACEQEFSQGIALAKAFHRVDDDFVFLLGGDRAVEIYNNQAVVVAGDDIGVVFHHLSRFLFGIGVLGRHHARKRIRNLCFAGFAFDDFQHADVALLTSPQRGGAVVRDLTSLSDYGV